MAYWTSLTREILNNNDYGDLELVNKDLKITTNKLVILREVIIERFKTNFKDFLLNPNYGANLDQYIGLGIDRYTKESIEFSLKKCLTFDDFLSKDVINIVTVKQKHKFKMFVYVNTGMSKLSVQTTYDPNTGEFEIA